VFLGLEIGEVLLKAAPGGSGDAQDVFRLLRGLLRRAGVALHSGSLTRRLGWSYNSW
jgi:hypothetical protein